FLGKKERGGISPALHGSCFGVSYFSLRRVELPDIDVILVEESEIQLVKDSTTLVEIPNKGFGLQSSFFYFKEPSNITLAQTTGLSLKELVFFCFPPSPYNKLIMAFLYKAKKTYLCAVAEELGIEVTEKVIKPQIIKAIMASEHFEEQLVSNMLEEEEVKSKEALEVEEKRKNRR
ncbi:hypothetical protein AVEN_157419-1, partial [Araneus ventricosus]